MVDGCVRIVSGVCGSQAICVMREEISDSNDASVSVAVAAFEG
jgi:hypothetical protein